MYILYLADDFQQAISSLAKKESQQSSLTTTRPICGDKKHSTSTFRSITLKTKNHVHLHPQSTIANQIISRFETLCSSATDLVLKAHKIDINAYYHQGQPLLPEL